MMLVIIGSQLLSTEDAAMVVNYEELLQVPFIQQYCNFEWMVIQ